MNVKWSLEKINSVIVWWRPREEWMPQCIRVSLMIRGRMYMYLLEWTRYFQLTIVSGNINAEKYRATFDNELWLVIAQHFPQNDFILQNDNTCKIHAYLQNWKHSHVASEGAKGRPEPTPSIPPPHFLAGNIFF